MSDTRKSASEIESHVEETRSRIDATISEIKDRFSTDTAVDYGVNYMRGEGGRNLLGAVRDNPLAALMMLAGAGWLLYTASQPEEERRRRRRERDDARHSLAERMSDPRDPAERERYLRRPPTPDVLPGARAGESIVPDAASARPSATAPAPGAGEPPFGTGSGNTTGNAGTLPAGSSGILSTGPGVSSSRDNDPLAPAAGGTKPVGSTSSVTSTGSVASTGSTATSGSALPTGSSSSSSFGSTSPSSPTTTSGSGTGSTHRDDKTS